MTRVKGWKTRGGREIRVPWLLRESCRFEKSLRLNFPAMVMIFRREISSNCIVIFRFR